MQTPASVLFLFLLSGSACAVFYTKSSDNDYPRIGRRSFFTTVNGNHYPRIGRRDSGSFPFLLAGPEFTSIRDLDKRGVFTQGAHGSYPRVGRRSEDDVFGEDYVAARNKLLKKLTEDTADEIRGVLEAAHSGVPLEVVFVTLDSDSDGKLSKDEFLSGLSQYHKQHSPIY